MNKSGYSLIEVMIAVGILMLAIVAPMTIAVKSIQSSSYTLEQNTATFLAQEAVSITEVARNTSLLEALNGGDGDARIFVTGSSPCESATGCNFDIQDLDILVDNPDNLTACTEDGENCRLYFDEDWARPKYRASFTNGGEPSPYIRRVFFNFSDHDGDGRNDELTIRSEVSWDSNFVGQEQQISVTTSFFDLYRSTAQEG